MLIEGYHACLTDGGHHKVAAEGPFQSTTCTYLGIGYYLWEGFKEHGIWWGETYIKRKLNRRYFVLRCDIDVDASPESHIYLDLLGRVEDKKLMMGLLKDACDMGYENPNMNLGDYIDWLRALNLEQPGIFPYRVIRALDSTNPHDSAHAVYFKEGSEQKLDLMPRVMICFHQKTDVHLHQVRVVHANT